MTSLVQRKARSGREAHAAREMSLARALRLTAAKQGDQLMSLALSALGVTRKTCGADDMTACLEGTSLILLMDGPGTQVAAAVLDHVLVAGLIQQQTMGKIHPLPEGEAPRGHTTTDAALCAPFIELLMRNAALMPEEEADATLLKGYRFGVWAQSPRQAKLALDANDYQVIEMTLDMAAGARVGKLTLILPQPRHIASEKEETGEVTSPAAPMLTLGQNVLGLHAELTIALTRFKMPLQQVRALKAGEVLDLNLSTMAHALIIDASGRAISRGTLGQIEGMRALQVEQKQAKQYTEPRRRASDREELDLPNVTSGATSANERRLQPAEDTYALPEMADVDIFGDMDDLPEMPDMDAAAKEADAQMARLKAQEEDAAEDSSQKQAGW
ncbi:FliM/FliN family flagellar motor C-terminal domain-containing protein [Sulfitobacter sp.]|uniref:FliM/FliN family flagellar motor C-terminal domain-containing protein n=1 Tax=Sulfitobacter sp. TaxID=1903071 RepID=UPI003002A710